MSQFDILPVSTDLLQKVSCCTNEYATFYPLFTDFFLKTIVEVALKYFSYKAKIWLGYDDYIIIIWSHCQDIFHMFLEHNNNDQIDITSFT